MKTESWNKHIWHLRSGAKCLWIGRALHVVERSRSWPASNEVLIRRDLNPETCRKAAMPISRCHTLNSWYVLKHVASLACWISIESLQYCSVLPRATDKIPVSEEFWIECPSSSSWIAVEILLKDSWHWPWQIWSFWVTSLALVAVAHSSLVFKHQKRRCQFDITAIRSVECRRLPSAPGTRLELLQVPLWALQLLQRHLRQTLQVATKLTNILELFDKYHTTIYIILHPNCQFKAIFTYSKEV